MRKINKVARIAGTVAVGGAAAVSALALTPGTFGGFTSTTTNPGNSVQAGTLTMTNSAAGAAVVTATDGLALDNLQPGDSATGSVTIENSGTLPADLKLAISNAINTFPTGDLNLAIEEGTTSIYSGTVADAAPIALGATSWTAGEQRTYSVTVSIPLDAGDDAQGDNASFQLDWSGAQH
jgi:hypothetical protein